MRCGSFELLRRRRVVAMSEPLLHQRQFVLATRPLPYRPDWKVVRLGESAVLSHCPKLSVVVERTRDGVAWCLIGTALDTTRVVSPEERIRESRSADIPSVYPDWSGRWVLIGENEVHLDASGQLGLYYVQDRDAIPESMPFASSSPALLGELLGEYAGERDPRELVWGVGVEWFPLPSSRFSRVRHLLPSQVLDLRQWTVRARPLIPDIGEPYEYEALLQGIEAGLLNVFRNVAAQFPSSTMWLGLSSGYDSRVLLAIGRKSGAQLRTFTHVRSEIRGRIGDMLLSPRLARVAGVPHDWVRSGSPRSDDVRLVNDHTAGSAVYEDGRFEPIGQPGDVVLFGATLESVFEHYFRRLPTSPPPAADLALAYGGVAMDDRCIAGLAEWLEWMGTAPQPMDWRSRFYIEQRTAGWVAPIWLSRDLAGRIDLAPFNSSRLIALGLALPPEKRDAKRWEDDLIRMVSPELMDLPFSPGWSCFSRRTQFLYCWRHDWLFPVKRAARRLARVAGGCSDRR